MTNIKLEHVSKIFKGKKKSDLVTAVDDFNLEINGKEFIVFVGPSGCGKSTTLRMIAGLEDISKGNLYIDSELMNSVEAKYRNIAMVFQNYALYPHMSAYDNMAFGLRNMKVPTVLKGKDGEPIKQIDKQALRDLEHELKDNYKEYKTALKMDDEAGKEACEKEKERILSDIEYFKNNKVVIYKDRHLKKNVIDEKVHEAAKILDIENLLDRKPGMMSGGQRQRVALGRALVRTPKVFLLDEPLSNLDAKLRGQMRVEITKLYEKLDVPFIYVTHDQVEAMTMGTRIVVLRNGVIQQIDSPTNLYDYPVNRFVAGFLGTPQMNFFETEMTKKGDILTIKLPNNNSFKANLNDLRQLNEEYLNSKPNKVIVGFRSENVVLTEEKDGINAYVTLVETLGNETLIYADFFKDDSLNISESASSFIVKVSGRTDHKVGDQIKVKIDSKKIHLFDVEQEKSIFCK